MTSALVRQPRVVWAVAFACVVAFMGIGLVDPILPALAQSFDATPSQVELLFTSYFAIIAVSMLVTGWISSRLGPKRTLLLGLVLVVCFSAASGAAGSIGQLVGFRAVWGLGNALFIATALSAIVGAASGGLSGAIILYEAALGLGIASGPLLGGELGAVSWRGPFFGTAALMAVGAIAIFVLLEKTPPAAQPTTLAAPIRALRHRGLLGLGLTAPLLQLRLLHAARVHAVPARARRARPRLRLLRLGRVARDRATAPRADRGLVALRRELARADAVLA